MTFYPGQKVIWIAQMRGGWGFTLRIPATVVKVNPKTIAIDAELMRGGTKRRNVKPENLVGIPRGIATS